MNMTPRDASIEIELIQQHIDRLLVRCRTADVFIVPTVLLDIKQRLGSLREFTHDLRKQLKPRHPPSVPRIPPRRERVQTIIGIAPNTEPGRPLGRLE
jgi:hypothetical protein